MGMFRGSWRRFQGKFQAGSSKLGDGLSCASSALLGQGDVIVSGKGSGACSGAFEAPAAAVGAITGMYYCTQTKDQSWMGSIWMTVTAKLTVLMCRVPLRSPSRILTVTKSSAASLTKKECSARLVEPALCSERTAKKLGLCS